MNLFKKVTRIILSKKKSLIICFIVVAVLTTSIIANTVLKSEKKEPANAYNSPNVNVTETAGTASSADISITEGSSMASSIDQSSPKSNNSSDTHSSKTSSIGTTGCVHNYTTRVVAPTCKEQGYTQHTCKKCGGSYRDSYLAPRHIYGKYLCDYCGLPDPERPVLSLSAWLKVNGTLSDDGRFYNIEYEENGVNYSISSSISEYVNCLYFDFSKGDENFSIYLDNTKQCSISYIKDRIVGRTEQKNSAVCSSSALKLDEFINNNGVECTQEEFTTQMIGKIDGFMNIIQNKLLYPRTGLKLKDYGFTAY